MGGKFIVVKEDFTSNVKHRLVSEKMDGVRAYWDGCRLLSRHGKEIEVPEEFLHGLPSDMTLDGELWMGRGTFEKLMSTLNSNQGDWSNIQYCVFDLPHSRSIHEKRMEQLNQIHFPQQVTTDNIIHLTFSTRCVLYPIQFAEEMSIFWMRDRKSVV